MTKTIDQAIEELSREIASDETATLRKKETVNTLCELQGRPLAYIIAEASQSAEVGLSFRSDEFYGEPLASSARRVLERAKSTGGSALSLDELFDALKAGGFAFDAKSDKYARRSLAISLSKNTATFIRLPHGDYGLRAWYKKSVSRRYGGSGAAPADEEDEYVELGPDDVSNMSDGEAGGSDQIVRLLGYESNSEPASGEEEAGSENSDESEGGDRQ